MKIIFSRKGFDGGTGGFASPIIDGKELISLPIPEPANYQPQDGHVKRHYSDIKIGEHILSQLIANLAPEYEIDNRLAHFDPDLIHSAVASRPIGWKPAFGQSGKAQRHLENQKVCKDDIFLFFGWFRRVQFQNGIYSYDNEDKNGKHVIFGWLQIGEKDQMTTILIGRSNTLITSAEQIEIPYMLQVTS